MTAETNTPQEGDVEIVCADCKEKFIFTDGEAQFFRSTFGDDFHPPKRCKTCREKRKPGKIQSFANGSTPEAPKRQRTR